jgi:hypothetical protein
MAYTPGNGALGALHHTCQGRRKRGESMTIRSAQTTIRMSMMNVVHDLSVLVAREEGLFREEGLDVDVIATAGTARATPVGEVLHAKIFDRSLETLYNGGGLDQYRMCEWA